MFHEREPKSGGEVTMRKDRVGMLHEHHGIEGRWALCVRMCDRISGLEWETRGKGKTKSFCVQCAFFEVARRMGGG